MKKGLLLIVVMVAAIAVKAQDIYVGGSLNVWRNSTGNTTSFKVAPEIGYNFNETWALGAELNYSHEYVKQVTPTHNLIFHMVKAFFTGGIICCIGQFILNTCENYGLDKDKCRINIASLLGSSGRNVLSLWNR